MKLEKEALIFTRGSYGKESPDTDKKTVLIAAGGTGLATSLKLGEKMNGEGKTVHNFYGMSIPGQEALEKDFKALGTFHYRRELFKIRRNPSRKLRPLHHRPPGIHGESSRGFHCHRRPRRRCIPLG